MMMIFNELRKHGQLAAKRHPMYEKNKYGKIIMYVGAIFWAGYLIFIGTSLAFLFAKSSTNREAYQMMNAVVLFFVLVADFMLRFPFQPTPTQEVKPYLLLPVKRNRLIDFLLIRSGLSTFNLIWLFLFLPFAIITIPKFFGVLGVITYCIGIWLLMVANNYWYLLCRTLMNERIWWVFLPVIVYVGIVCALFIPKGDSPMFGFFLHVGDGYIEGNILYFLGTIALIAMWWFINRAVMSRLIYNALNKVEDTKVKHVSEYKFLERYGEVGEYMRLEVKMLFRNKRCKSSLRSVALVVIMFALILSFGSAYNSGVMNTFVVFYTFIVFGMVMLIQIMGFEGNYIDGLMSRKESIMSLLRAKYYVYSIGEIVPLLLMLPAMIMGKLTVLEAISFVLFTTGPVYFVFFQLAVYNKKSVPLNEGMMGRQSTNNVLQIVVNIATFGVPLASYSLLKNFCGPLTAQIIFLVIGLGFTLTSPLWIRNVYNRFMLRRYENMEGFRDSR